MRGHVNMCVGPVQALAQTDGYLRRLNVVKEAVDDTAGAAQVRRVGRGRGRACEPRDKGGCRSMRVVKRVARLCVLRTA
jgi:hypothetical protein